MTRRQHPAPHAPPSRADGDAKTRADGEAPSKRPRVARVDHARGLAIFLVVVGHVVGGLAASGIPGDHLSEALHSLHLKNSFRMPALFFIAGVFIERGLRKGLGTFVREKAGDLLYPYFLWNLLVWGLIDLAHFVGNVFGRKLVNTPPTDWWIVIKSLYHPIGTWFLYALFATMLLYALLRKAGVRIHVLLALGLVMHVAARLGLVDDIEMLFQLGRLFPYLCLGAILSDWLLRVGLNAPLWKPIVVTVASAALLAWLSSLPIMSSAVPLPSSPDAAADTDAALLVLRAQRIPFRIAIALCGIAALWALAIVFERLAGPRLVQYWGRISMEVYIASGMGMVASRIILVNLGVSQAWILILAGITAGMAFPMILVWLVRFTGFNYLFRWGKPSAAYPLPQTAPT
ncbi:MAG: acyltransferase family protein [Phycisphaerales bacterium]